ncbi:hypothetical protein, partial [Lonsdalea quercina]|uniref:hypothetical protein n=1 Tax=Lonsdalea quercina TaxID=71657 RepID=UPI00397521AD
ASEYGIEWLHADAAYSTHDLILLIASVKKGRITHPPLSHSCFQSRQAQRSSGLDCGNNNEANHRVNN